MTRANFIWPTGVLEMRLTHLLAGLGLLLAILLGTVEASHAAPPRFKRVMPRPTASTTDTKPAEDDPLTAPLVAPAMLVKLKLTSEQKPKVDDLCKEFAAKLKEIASAVKKNSDNDPAPAKGAKPAKADTAKAKGKGKGKGIAPKKGADNTEEFAKANDLRNDYEDKLNDLLTEAQQKILEDVKIARGEAALKASADGSSASTTTPKKKQK